MTGRLGAAALALLAFGVLLLSGPPAFAHDALVSTSPTAGSALARQPARVVLRFDQPVGEHYGSVVVTGPGGGRWQQGKPRVRGSTVTQPLRPLGPAGKYSVAWRVISADGHPVSDRFAFTLTAGGKGTPAAIRPVERSGEASGAAVDRGGYRAEGPGWVVQLAILVAVAVGIVILVVGGAALLRRRRSDAG